MDIKAWAIRVADFSEWAVDIARTAIITACGWILVDVLELDLSSDPKVWGICALCLFILLGILRGGKAGRPEIIGKIKGYKRIGSEDQPVALLVVEVHNRGVPTSLLDFKVQASVGGRNVPMLLAAGNVQLSSGDGKGPTVWIRAREHIDNKTVDPIRTGETRRGILLAFSPKLTASDLDSQGTKFEIAFSDAYGQLWRLEESERTDVLNAPMEIPGVQIQYGLPGQGPPTEPGAPPPAVVDLRQAPNKESG